MIMLGISGSLKSTSSNTSVLQVIRGILNERQINMTLYEGLDSLPHFSPEKDGDQHEAVNQLRYRVRQADAVVICTPEYAFGVPGVLKNALDWLVSSGELNEKPVAALSASPLPTGGDKAHASLMNTLSALGCRVGEAKLTIPAIKKKIGDNGNVLDSQFRLDLAAVVDQLLAVVNEGRLASKAVND